MSLDWSTNLLFLVYAVLTLAAFSSYFYFIIFQKSKHTREREFDQKERGDSVMVNRVTREWWLWFTSPIENYFVRNKVSPNTISLIGFIITAMSCIGFSFGWFVFAGWCVLLGGTMDIFDGKVARKLNMETKSGDYFDANLDRLGEALMYLGLLNFYSNQLFFYVVFTAFVSASMISYSKARGEISGVTMKGIGLMQRPERIVWIGVPCIASPLFAGLVNYWIPVSKTWLASVGITVVAIMGAYSYFQRYSHVAKQLKARD